MKPKILITLLVSHVFVGGVGFVIGIFLLPIIIAPNAPTEDEILKISEQSDYFAEFKRELKSSDFFHWGEGKVSIGPDYITLKGSLAPGPDYKLYISPEYIETEMDFNRLKSSMIRVGEVSTFDNFVVKLSPSIDLSKYNTVIIWCEAFGEFITSAKYR
jgi:hypothetical protein